MLDELGQHKIIAVLRNVPEEELIPLADALFEGGIRFLEVTFGKTDALSGIARLRSRFEHRVHVGAGTVTNRIRAKEALDAGAEYLLAPGMNDAEEIIRLAHERKALVIPGAFTPTEIEQAISYNADAVKVFPAAVLGAPYLKHIRGPLGDVKLIPTGGVSIDNIESYLDAGAYAVGIGGNLVKGKTEAVQNVANQYVKAVQRHFLERNP